MADNYLEKRMEDLRNGRLGTSSSTRIRTTGAKKETRSSLPMEGLRVVVTGGACGIGHEIVKEFRKAGASVDIVDIDRKNGMATAQATGAMFHPVDLADAQAYTDCLTRIIEYRKDIDVIVNDAAIMDFCSIEENDAERLIRSMQVNVAPILTGASLLARHRASLPEENPYGGRIINISSTRAMMSEEGTECYSASKGAVSALTHALMMSLAKYGITVNSISPGWILTDPSEPTSEADRMQHPSRRIGTPADVARICLFIAQRDNNFINGENITVDGGMSRRMIYV